MATVDELFATMTVDDTTTDSLLIINPDTREISVPDSERVFGVESDSNAEKKHFLCPRIVGNGVDLSSCFVRVNYRNANGDIDSYLVHDVTVVGDNVTFSWELSRKVTTYEGLIKFVVCAGYANREGNISNEWNTTLATGTVLEGLEPTIERVEETTSEILTQLLSVVAVQTENVKNEGATQVNLVKSEGATQIEAVEQVAESARIAVEASIEAKGTNTLATIPEDYTGLSKAVDGLTRTRATAIVCEVEGEAVTMSDASDLPLQGLRIFGRSTQNGVPSPDAPVEIKSVESPVVTVCGKNLIPYPYADTTRTTNGVTFTDNGDGSVTVNGTATDSAIFNLSLNDKNVYGAGIYILSGTPSDAPDGAYICNQGASDLDTGEGLVVTKGDGFANGYKIAVRSGVTVNNLIFYPMLRRAEFVDDVYETYTDQKLSTTYTLPGIPVSSGGNYVDGDGQQWICDEVDLEHGVRVQRCRVVTVNSVVGMDSSGTLFKAYDNGALKTNYDSNQYILSDKYVGRTLIDCKSSDYGVSHYGKVIYVRNKDWVDVLAANTVLVENPVSFIALLDKPIETPLSDAELNAYRALCSNKPNTTVLNSEGAHMIVSYAADTKLYIDNLIKEALS